MNKRFNTTGLCIPEKHYMVDITDKINGILKMVEHGDYFVISRPRQYGKTTTLYMLNRRLKTSNEYLPIKMSFEGIGQEGFENAAVFIDEFLLLLEQGLKSSPAKNMLSFIESEPKPDRLSKLDLWITDFVKTSGKKIVLMIDEVDKSSNNQLFLDFLGMLRNKYLKRDEEEQYTFHSVILAGLHDVKSLKVKLRPEAEAKFNSPWNIAVDFDLNMAFSPDEIRSMLEDYSVTEQINLDTTYFSERLYYLTSGYPFLVSLLCKFISEKILPMKASNQNKWEAEDFEKAAQLALKNENTNFESLIQNLENNRDLYEFIFNIIMNGAQYVFNRHTPLIHFGSLYGILKDHKGKVTVHNRVYEQIIYNYMASKLETSSRVVFDHFTSRYIKSDGELDIQKVFLKFQEFMKENYAKKDLGFLERNGRLLFLAFIRPILNGRGFDFKEVQISAENRLDIVVTFDNKKYIIELKIWRGDEYHQKGLCQLSNYLDMQNQSSGYLLIFDLRKESGRVGETETFEVEGKNIFAAWV